MIETALDNKDIYTIHHYHEIITAGECETLSLTASTEDAKELAKELNQEVYWT